MKDLGPTHCILGMEIKRDIARKKIWLSHQEYIEGILKRFNMQDCKPFKVPILVGTNLYADQCRISQEEREYIACVPYYNAFGSLMYAMVGTRPNIAHAMEALRRYIVTP